MGDEGSEPTPCPDERVEVLSVSPHEDAHAWLRSIFQQSNWTLYEAFGCREALALARKYDIHVIICERNMPDGDWRTLLNQVKLLPSRPRLILFSRTADWQLLGEVLELGGFDVLSTPFNAKEVLVVAFLAWHSSLNEVERRAADKAVRPAGRGHVGAIIQASGTAD